MSQKPDQIRVMGWNFLEGGLSRPDPSGRRTLHPERRAAAQALVARLDPDVLIVNEALGCTPHTENAPYTDYAALFGRAHGAAARYDGIWGNAIVSRFPIIEVREGLLYTSGSPMNRGWIAAHIDAPSGPFWVGTYHPHPCRSPRLRRGDVAGMLDAMDGPAVFLGDLNAVSPAPDTDEHALVDIFTRFQDKEHALHSAALFHQSGHLLFDAVEGLFPQRGFVRAIQEPVSTMPTALIRQPGDVGLRIDHILASPEFRVQRGWVERAPEADVASDHYPVLAELGWAER